MIDNKIKKIFSMIPALATEGMIFFFSAQNGDESGALSGGIAAKVARFIFKIFGNGRNPEESEEFLRKLESAIREMGHAGEHALLMLTVFLAVSAFIKKENGKLNYVLRICAAFIITVFCAFLDELHQYFIPGRASEIFDVFVDTMGALTMALFITVIRLLTNSRKKN